MALIRAHELKCGTLQIFTHSPRSWRINAISPAEAARFKETRASLKIGPVFAHASYLINIASINEPLRVKSARMLREEMLRADAIGAEYVVLHPGSAHDPNGIERAAKSIDDALSGLKTRTRLLLENTSGKKGDIASTPGQISEIMSYSGGLAFGICLDTCHAFAAGYDISKQRGIDGLIAEIDASIGLQRVKLIHLNDCKGGLGSGLDRHWHVGKGNIGARGLGRLLRLRGLIGVPVVLETPKDGGDDDAENLARLRRLMHAG